MKKPVIFLSGGGTMGSVMPLVALWERLRDDFDCIWIGSRKGIEKAYIEGLGVKYQAIPAGKFRHYFSLRTLAAPLFILSGVIISKWLILRHRPKIAVVSGSFVSVPLVWAARFFGVPAVVHQEDLKIGLAGRLTIPLASAVTTAFKETLQVVRNKNKFWIGNPVRNFFYHAPSERKDELPLILVMGGGLGSDAINKAVEEIAPEICREARIIHLAGKNKSDFTCKNYQRKEAIWGEELALAMAKADIIVSRAGLSTLGELAALGKPAILVPLEGVGQKENARYLENKKAAIVLEQAALGELGVKLRGLLADKTIRKELSENIKKIFPTDAAEKLEQIVVKIIK